MTYDRVAIVISIARVRARARHDRDVFSRVSPAEDFEGSACKANWYRSKFMSDHKPRFYLRLSPKDFRHKRRISLDKNGPRVRFDTYVGPYEHLSDLHYFYRVIARN